MSALGPCPIMNFIDRELPLADSVSSRVFRHAMKEILLRYIDTLDPAPSGEAVEVPKPREFDSTGLELLDPRLALAEKALEAIEDEFCFPADSPHEWAQLGRQALAALRRTAGGEG